MYLAARSSLRITSRFSALPSSAAFVKLKLPVMTVWPSMTMILLWAIGCLRRSCVGMPAWSTKSADVYFSPFWDLSKMTSTLTPRLWASTKALAIGADVKRIGLDEDRGLGLAQFLAPRPPCSRPAG